MRKLLIFSCHRPFKELILIPCSFLVVFLQLLVLLICLNQRVYCQVQCSQEKTIWSLMVSSVGLASFLLLSVKFNGKVSTSSENCADWSQRNSSKMCACHSSNQKHFCSLTQKEITKYCLGSLLYFRGRTVGDVLVLFEFIFHLISSRKEVRSTWGCKISTFMQRQNTF